MFRTLIAAVLIALLGPSTRADDDISPKQIVKLANRERSRPLVMDDQLREAAERKIDDMIEKGYFAHTHGSSTPWKFMREAGYDFKSAAENLGQGYKTAEEAHRAWMRSKGHRRNILGDFEDIGVAVRDDLIVVMFGKR